jgi:hypothetical protein
MKYKDLQQAGSTGVVNIDGVVGFLLHIFAVLLGLWMIFREYVCTHFGSVSSHFAIFLVFRYACH